MAPVQAREVKPAPQAVWSGIIHDGPTHRVPIFLIGQPIGGALLPTGPPGGMPFSSLCKGATMLTAVQCSELSLSPLTCFVSLPHAPTKQGLLSPFPHAP